MNFRIAPVVVFSFFWLLAGCQTTSRSDIQHLGGDVLSEPNSPGFAKVVIFNDSSFVLFGMDESKEISVKINGQAIAKLEPGRYAQILVPSGIYTVNLAHWDLRRFSSEQQVPFTPGNCFLRIRATPDANEARLVPELPPEFKKKFRPKK